MTEISITLELKTWIVGGTEHYGTIPVQGLESLLWKPVKD